jgi:uncharacterized damage-inducible protein DinB
MTERDRLIDQLQREYDGTPWHGPSLTQILDGITAEQAARRVAAAAHSIWEILLHMTAWKREVTRRLQGHTAGEPEVGDWPVTGEASQARWQAAQKDHARAQQELIAALRALDDQGLAAKVEGDTAVSIGAGISKAATVYGILQHDTYHAGQIALLKRALQ